MLTVVGPGGVGKTRLVTHALPGLRSAFPDGVWWCDLAVITGGAEQAVASVLGIAERAGVSLADRLREFLADRDCLVVLDNCEHLVDEAARLAELLATSGGGVGVLATSREALGVDGEGLFTLGPLAADGAALLFRDRARAHDVPLVNDQESRDAVAGICRRLDGLPPAIELAAARTRSLSIAEILQQLDTRGSGFLSNPHRAASGRHRDMWSVVDWSYRLLGPADRTLPARLSIFAGPFDRVAAAAVCAGGDVPAERLDVQLGGLVDKSLVVVGRGVGTTRYRLLETVREFGAHRPAPQQQRQGRMRHARHFIEAVRRAERLLWGPEEQRGSRSIDGELAELRAAHHFLRDIGDAENLLGLSAPLSWFLTNRSRTERHRWAEAAIALDAAADLPAFGPICAQAGYGAWQRGDHAWAAELVKRGLAGHGPVGGLHHVASDLELFKGRMDECLRLHRLAKEAFTAEGNHAWAEMSEVVNVLAHVRSGRL